MIQSECNSFVTNLLENESSYELLFCLGYKSKGHQCPDNDQGPPKWIEANVSRLMNAYLKLVIFTW